MLPAGGIQGGLSPIDSLLPPLSLFSLSRLLLGACALSPLPLLLEQRGLAIRRLVDGLLGILLRPAAPNLAVGLLRSAVAGDNGP
jgi:hypothetical protein